MRKRKCKGGELGEEEQIWPFRMLTLNTAHQITYCTAEVAHDNNMVHILSVV